MAYSQQQALRNRSLSINRNRRMNSMPVQAQVLVSNNSAQTATDSDYDKRLSDYNKAVADYEKQNQESINRYQTELKNYLIELEKSKADEAEYQRQLEEYNKKQAEYEAEVAEYNKQKAEYDKQLAEYNKQQEEYNKQLKDIEDYNRRVDAENAEWAQAEHIIFKGKSYAAQGDTSTEGKFTSMQYKVNYLLENGYLSADQLVQKRNAAELQALKPVFTDSLGQPMSIDPEKLGYQGFTTKEGVVFKEIPKAPTYNLPSITTTPAQVQSKITDLPQVKLTAPVLQAQAPNTNLLPQRPLSTLTPAPTFKQQFQESVKRSGYVEGTLNFFGSKISEGYTKTEQKLKTVIPGYQVYQPEATRNLLRSTPSAAYFTPIGGGLLFAKGTESFVTPSGRERLNLEIKERIASGTPVFGAYVRTYTRPVFDIGLGGVAVIGQAKSAIAAREVKAFEEAPTFIKGTRYEGEAGGMDVITAVKKVGKKEYITQVKQPFINVNEQRIALENGRGISILKSGNKAEFTIFETGGKAVRVDSTPKLINTVNDLKVTRNLEGLEAGVGRVYTKPTIKGNIEVQQVLTPSGIPKANVIVNYNKVRNPSKSYESFLGVSKQEDKLIGIIGGNAGKAKISEKGISVLAKPKTYGVLKRVEISLPSKDPGFKIIRGNGPSTSLADSFNQLDKASGQILKQTAKNQATASYVKTLAESGLKNIGPKVKQVSILERSPGALSTSKYAGTGVYERYSPSENINALPFLSLKKESVTTENLGNNQFRTIEQSAKFESGTTGRFNNLGTTKSRLSFDLEAPEKIKERSFESPKEIVKPRAKDNVKPSLRQNLNQILLESPAFKQPQKQKQNTKQKTEFKNPTTTTTPNTTRTDFRNKTPIPRAVPILPKGKGDSDTRRQLISELSKSYDVVVKRKGKTETIGKALPYGKALELGVRTSKGSTVQTFGLKEKGYTKEKDIRFNVPGNLFGTPKREKTKIAPITFTEKRGKTLTEKKEVSDILKEKKKRRFSFF